jgi:exodeoxyribonuclease-5
MEYSPQQVAGIRAGRAWVKSVLAGTTAKRTWILTGYAGTGKSTILPEILDGVSGVGYYAPTGKAAQVMRSKGCHGATTIHRGLYKVLQKGTSKLEDLLAKLRKAEASMVIAIGGPAATREEVEALKSQIEAEEEHLRALAFCENDEAPMRQDRVIVVDEGSMIGSQIGRDMEALGTPILVMGDPGQLPPIRDSAYFMDRTPDVLLTEVHRQALDSGILRLATDLRNGKGYHVGEYGPDCRVVRRRQPGNEELVLSADQMLVGLNRSRRDANFTLRSAKGREDPFPMVGDKLVCLRNNNDLGLMNGAQFEVVAPGRRMGIVVADVELSPLDTESPQATVDMHACVFQGKEISAKDWRVAEQFDHGEAMTVHKAQGSQWPRVYGLDESEKFDERWLYTLATRAEKDLTLVAR